jgi:hypothetical protein
LKDLRVNILFLQAAFGATRVLCRKHVAQHRCHWQIGERRIGRYWWLTGKLNENVGYIACGRG